MNAMAHETFPSFPSRRAFRDALASGYPIHVIEPRTGQPHTFGKVSIQGPVGAPVPRWYATVDLIAGKIIREFPYD